MNVIRRFATTVCLVLFTVQVNAAMPPQSGEKAPDWILTGAQGKTISLYEDSAEQPAVIVFWATWCPYCHELLPKIERLRQELAAEGVKFYALNVWEDSDPAAYMKKNQLGLELVLEADTVAQRYGVVGTPGLFVMSADKTITYIRQRGTSSDEAISSIKAALIPAAAGAERQALSSAEQ